jgi:hypothetical protein
MVLALILLALTDVSYAPTTIIKADGSGDYPTIQAAIDDANHVEILELQTGTYTSNGMDVDYRCYLMAKNHGSASCGRLRNNADTF